MNTHLRVIDSVLIYVADVARSVAYYQSLGFDIKRNEVGLGVVAIGEFEIHIHDQFEKDRPGYRNSPSIVGSPTLYMYIRVQGIDQYFDEIKARALTFTNPTDMAWGNREFSITDPDGYNIVFYECENNS
jgi:uncharacterized glyoxalase superfamily protein PhnB